MVIIKCLILFLLAGVMTWLLTRFLITLLPHYNLIDVPNERSSHKTPTPRGGGIAIICALMVCWSLIVFMFGVLWPFFFVAGACVVSAISLWDDMRSVSPWVRLGVQFLAAIITIPYIDFYGNVFGGWLPEFLDKTLAVIVWVGFMNFFNFMDGIDGISAMETIVITVGVLLIACFSHLLQVDAAMAFVLLGAALGFGYWNKTPSRIFLGDVGSVALGFVLGGLLLRLAGAGYYAAAMILPMYYIFDAGITLLMRIKRRERLFQGHLGHFFQVAILRGETHQRVTSQVGMVGAILIILSLFSLVLPVLSFLLAVLVCSSFCYYLHKGYLFK